MKIKIHPFFIAVAALLVGFYGLSAFVSSFFAVLAHELAHAFAARQRGYVTGDIILLPYGAVLYNRDNLDKTGNIIVALAGPLANFLISLVTIAFWWIAPETYAFTRAFVTANITIGFFNLLPVWPLDGARAVFALAGYRPRAAKGLKCGSLAVAALLIAMFFFTLSRGTPNFTFPIMAVFLATGAFASSDKEYFDYVRHSSPAVKDFENGVTLEVVAVSADISLLRILKMITPQKKLTFAVMENGVEKTRISEEEMQVLLNTNQLTKSLGEVARLPQSYTPI